MWKRERLLGLERRDNTTFLIERHEPVLFLPLQQDSCLRQSARTLTEMIVISSMPSIRGRVRSPRHLPRRTPCFYSKMHRMEQRKQSKNVLRLFLLSFSLYTVLLMFLVSTHTFTRPRWGSSCCAGRRHPAGGSGWSGDRWQRTAGAMRPDRGTGASRNGCRRASIAQHGRRA